MTQHRITVAMALVLALAFTGLAAAQGTTGSINGRVSDASGNPLPGVTVSLTAPGLPGTKTTITSSQR